MPIYEYHCRDCRRSFEIALTLVEHEKSKVKCPKCGGKKMTQEPAAFYAVTSRKS